MTPKLIKTEDEYQNALERVDALMDARPGTPEMDELELLVHLVEAYEEEAYPIPQPDPVAAIQFVMEQKGLRAGDLVPFIGSKGRVSEVLNRKRSLSLSMIRRLHEGLGIPADLLIREAETQPSPRFDQVDWEAFPLSEIVRRRWFGDSVTEKRQLLRHAEELLGGLILASEQACPGLATLRISPTANRHEISPGLSAWKARVWDLARRQEVEAQGGATIDKDLISQIAKLSLVEQGPLVARDMLAKVGVRLVVEGQLPGTRLDGAAMRCADGSAIIGLTLRYDRLDYFWFTLCHELAHLALHVKDAEDAFVADTFDDSDEVAIEVEANQLTEDAMIPPEEWTAFIKRGQPSYADVESFARRHLLHPAIVAGRYRKYARDYSQFTSLLGNRKVRSLFSAAST